VFYKRRVSRIFPVFLLFVVATYGAAWYVRGTMSWAELLSTAAFLRTYLPASPGIWQADLPIGHLWSLNAEEHSYVFLSIVASLAFLRGREGWLLAGAGVLAIVLHVAYIKIPGLMPRSGDMGTEVVASHLLLSAGYCLIRERFRRFVWPWMPVAALVSAGICYTSLAPWWSAMLLSPFLLAFSINHLADTPDVFRRVLALQWLRLLGVWSYSLYIWQQPFFKFQAVLVPGGALAGALMVGVASFYCFENPLRSWLNKNW
jgi:peptidoglycan/LPS O-acetylase OafA/YrhL